MVARAAGAVDGKLKGRLENVCWQRVQICSEGFNPRFWLWIPIECSESSERDGEGSKAWVNDGWLGVVMLSEEKARPAIIQAASLES